MGKKFALVTGASGGIGCAIAKQLIEENYGVYLHYFQNKEGVEKLLEQYKDDHKEIYLVQADLSKQNGVSDLLCQINHPIDDLLLVSGNSYFGLVTDMEENKVHEMVQLHITSPFLLAKAFVPSMISKKKGNIILITSVWGVVGASCEVLYSMLKGGQNTFVKALAKEVAPSNIRINAVAPGAINTSMLASFSETEINQLVDEIPMGRLGEPEEVAHTVSFLLSNKACYLNGQVISINGAWHT
ncbi:elongation factor P 5-aminopentanone reductase [Bacillus sp. DJP31]|uniref:elongation factor P 5-aminopentanone reductase n=1 Tax=Bacillus sp. DJP31 TaxID=3409789 RepID=UPI003BB743DB